jgi:ribosome-binding factor A
MRRIDRINEEVSKELTMIFRNVKDPRVSGAFISISSVDVSGDLSFAKVYYSLLMGDSAEVKKGLISASGYIRSELARRLNLRNTPKLNFIEDHVTERAIHISQVLKEIDEKRTQIEAENKDKSDNSEE